MAIRFNSKNQLLFIFSFCGIIILSNFLLIYRLISNKSINKKLENYMNIMISKNHQNEFYIEQNILCSMSSYERILQYIEKYDSTFYTRDTTFILLLPKDACYTCVIDLFKEINQLKIDINSIYLIMEKQDKQIQRDWLSYNFKYHCFDEQNIFTSLNLKDNPVIIKTTAKKIDNIILINQGISPKLLSLFFYKKIIT